MTPQESLEVIKALAWPVTVLTALAALYQPISELIRTIGRRASKLSVFKVEIELGKLAQARSSLETTIEGLRKAVVSESGIAPIAASVTRSGTADYVVVALGDDSDQEWLTSRLFLLAAILERSRAVRCIVFTGRIGCFLGAATPRDVRSDLGARFPEYERALFRAYGDAAILGLEEFRSGDLSENAVNVIARKFIPTDIVSFTLPQQPGRWIYLDRSKDGPAAGPSSWEFAEWVTVGLLQSLLRDRLSSGSVVATSGKASEDTTRSIVRQPGMFVALLGASNNFQGLCDRRAIIDRIALNAIEQVGDS